MQLDYHQCQPGAAPAPVPEPSPIPSDPDTSPSDPSIPGTPAGSGPGTELQKGYYWIRAVAAPNFHKYLQSKPLYTTSKAVLGSHTTAGQFQVVDGQLVQLVSGAGEKPEKLLYGVVSQETYNNNRKSITTSPTFFRTFLYLYYDLTCGLYILNADFIFPLQNPCSSLSQRQRTRTEPSRGKVMDSPGRFPASRGLT